MQAYLRFIGGSFGTDYLRMSFRGQSCFHHFSNTPQAQHRYSAPSCRPLRSFVDLRICHSMASDFVDKIHQHIAVLLLLFVLLGRHITSVRRRSHPHVPVKTDGIRSTHLPPNGRSHAPPPQPLYILVRIYWSVLFIDNLYLKCRKRRHSPTRTTWCRTNARSSSIQSTSIYIYKYLNIQKY